MADPFQLTRRGLLAAFPGVPLVSLAQPATMLPLPRARVQAPDGTVYPGALLYAYFSGTTTPAPMYLDADLATVHHGPARADAEGLLPPIFLNPTIVYRLMATTGADAAIPSLDIDPVSAASLHDARFAQVGDGAVARTVGARTQDVLSVKDYGAVGDGRAQDGPAFARAAVASLGGGPLDVTSGIHLIGDQFFGPSRGTVHAYDHAIVGDEDILTNGTFAQRGAGWTLRGFAPTGAGVVHAAGREAFAKRVVTVRAYTTYLIAVTLDTRNAGGIAFFLGGEPIFTAGDYSMVPVGIDTYQFVMFSYALDGPVLFELHTDADWTGSVTNLSVTRVKREAPYDFFSIPSDKKDFTNLAGVKFGRFLSGNIGIGDRLTNSLFSQKAAWNIAIGARSLSSNIDGIENTATGTFCLEYNQASRNTAGGYSSFRYNTKGERNTGWGYKSFGRNSTGSGNTGVGFWASMYNQMGNNNSSFGVQASYYNCNGNYNSAFGAQAGLQNDGGSANTFVGAISGPYTPGSTTFDYSFCTCVGAESKAYGNRTTAVGNEARCGSDPHAGGFAILATAVALGYRAIAARDHSLAVGGESNAGATCGTAVGDRAEVRGDGGTAIGCSSSADTQSIAIGSQAANNLIGSGNITIGTRANRFAAQARYSNTVVIGYEACASANNQIVLGNAATTEIRAAVAHITTLSDRRDKADINAIDGEFASRFVRSLSPVRWKWNVRDDVKRQGEDIGFIAQDLLAAQGLHNADWLDLVNKSDAEKLEATPAKLLPIVVAALNAAFRRIETLENLVGER